MIDQMLAFSTMLVSLAIFSFAWKHGPQLMTKLHAIAKAIVKSLMRPLPKVRSPKALQRDLYRQLSQTQSKDCTPCKPDPTLDRLFAGMQK